MFQLLLIISLTVFGTGAVESEIDNDVLHSNVSIHPNFGFNVARNVTTAVGHTAFLHCRVEQLGDKAVSWIRKRDLHILTAGILTYTSDQRFQVIRPEHSENWTLQIKFPQLRDSGVYECQVNTEPKISLPFRLNVIEAKAKILGPADLYVQAGSSIVLTCIIPQGPHDLGTVSWYKGEKVLETSEPRVNDANYKERLVIENQWTDVLSSRMQISRAHLMDSGNYSCVPTTAGAASVNVHIINGEHPAAMQHGTRNTASLSLSIPITIVYSLFIILIKHGR